MSTVGIVAIVIGGIFVVLALIVAGLLIGAFVTRQMILQDAYADLEEYPMKRLDTFISEEYGERK